MHKAIVEYDAVSIHKSICFLLKKRRCLPPKILFQYEKLYQFKTALLKGNLFLKVYIIFSILKKKRTKI